jgi:hypothetical protein
MFWHVSPQDSEQVIRNSSTQHPHAMLTKLSTMTETLTGVGSIATTISCLTKHI